MPPSSSHPLTKPGWVAFSLVALAAPMAMLFSPPPPEPLPHLARLPTGQWTSLHGGPPGFESTGAFVDVTAWPCSEPCIARTATLAALAHSSASPPLLTIFTTAPDAHPAMDAAQAVSGWRIVRAEGADSEAVHAAWYAARRDMDVSGGGILLVDETGSVRAVLPASPEGVSAALSAWDQLQASDPG